MSLEVALEYPHLVRFVRLFIILTNNSQMTATSVLSHWRDSIPSETLPSSRNLRKD